MVAEQLVLFVGTGELHKVQWPDIDLRGGEWRLTGTKSDMPQVAPLARQAIEILRESHPSTGHGLCVFPISAIRIGSGR